MFDLLKLGLLLAGGAAFYGLATGADLNELFKSISESAVPVLSEVLKGIWEFIKRSIQ